MATAENILRAKALASLGVWTFPVYVTQDPENPYKTAKKPGTPNGFYDATNDPFLLEDLFERHGKAEVGVWMEPSGLVAADIDVKRSPEGEILVDGFEEFDKAWLDLPSTHAFDSISGAGGKQFIYLAPEGVKLGPDSNYRGIKGVDRRGGGSYSVWNGPVPKSRDSFKPAPEWLLDEKTVRSADKFEGDVREWYESLEPGEPSVIVRAAMDRAREAFEKGGNDYSHSDLVERQYEAVRLGSEGHPGVPQLLSVIEELFHAREGSHSRGEEDWDYEFQEALSSGIQKHGGATELRKSLPVYSLNVVPTSVPDRLLTGAPGNKDTFRELLAELIKSTDDDALVTSVLWNSPRTKDISREWGLIFVSERVKSAREKPEPVRENPTIPERAPTPSDVNVTSTSSDVNVTSGFLTTGEQAVVSRTHTFIDKYLAATASKGFTNTAYAIPAAWTALSMAFGLKAVIPKGVNLGVNLWFMPLGESGTGKSSESAFLKHVLDHLLKDGEGYYNLGAMSSPEGILLELLTRDGKPSMIFQDEASSFFQALRDKDWVKALEYDLSNYYMGDVPPSNKISLKELRGKSAETSFNIFMIATPDRLLKLINTDMFATGFMARYNWMWAAPPVETDDKYLATRSENDTEKNAPSVTFALSGDLAHASSLLTSRVAVWGTDEAVARLSKAHKAFDKAAKPHEKYDALEPAITRLGRETIWKCAALLALYRGETIFTLNDALVAIHYATGWYENLSRVVEATSESDFSADVSEIEAYIKGQGGTVTSAKLLHRFRNMIRNSPRELDDRVNFLVQSGRVLNNRGDNKVSYTINGG